MKNTGRKAALHTLGCKVNTYETDAMRAMLEEAGYQIVPFDSAADVYVINTCSVTNIADRKSRQMISRARKMNPGAVVVAAGCYVQTALEKTGKSVDADIILGTGRKGELIGELDRCLSRREDARSSAQQDPASVRIGDVMHEAGFEELMLPRIEGHTRAYIKVQDGCNMFCSYCIIPFARGRIRSRRQEDVIRELEGLARSGVREVVLTGIHLSSYGVDASGDVEDAYGSEGEKKTWQQRSKLIDLVEAVSRVDGIERIRLGSLEPSIVTEEFALRLARLEKVCPHFHLSLQSGSDSVLRRMNRHYTAAEYRERVEILRRVFDEPAVTTDVIVGFPGETEEEFEETRRFLESVRLYETHLFRYSVRKGTRAASMQGQIPESVKERRAAVLAGLNRICGREFEKARSGRETSMLVEEEARIGGDGSVSVPNAGAIPVNAAFLSDRISAGERLFTGYTREYVRAFVLSREDLRGKIINGKLKVESLPLFEYT